jgi:NAD(P)-dependent dehydrogenase (short-subunit alcohol dehydrogenase family)
MMNQPATLPGIGLFNLAGRTALVTGGSRGLGFAMAAGLASAGADVMLVTPQYSRETARLIAYQPYIEAMGNLSVRADVLIFPRYDVMRHLVETNQLQLEGLSPAQAAATADRLYDCIARQVARVLLRAMAAAPR